MTWGSDCLANLQGDEVLVRCPLPAGAYSELSAVNRVGDNVKILEALSATQSTSDCTCSGLTIQEHHLGLLNKPEEGVSFGRVAGTDRPRPFPATGAPPTPAAP